MEKKHIRLILFAVAAGVVYLSYGLYQKVGKLGTSEILVIAVTAAAALLILWIVNNLQKKKAD
ncbi:hypothetical protein EDD80_10219 [Anseongella ginsenosidimutans]|uniref:Uncharacterized protein n=1 Tax=Anseongella ginsenosidimutans TaxID=496056 RepID=A0A4R3KTZ6_9SPHI|nr:hypothetical protein [Anseongella ginsenosidimutans]QEC51517.1 hypothetical protein FRZ59_03535 [Anseongella ginsenosidimutans]TCS88829.1 hypothetical protein EDD80_10219 [Anseongella ginsenosidimutans]